MTYKTTNRYGDTIRILKVDNKTSKMLVQVHNAKGRKSFRGWLEEAGDGEKFYLPYRGERLYYEQFVAEAPVPYKAR